MKKIVEYKLMWADNAENFERLVNEKLKEGWDLYGCVHCDGGRWHQAMVKYQRVERNEKVYS